MMQAAPFVLYHLAQLRQEELDRAARVAWQRSDSARAGAARHSRSAAPVTCLDAVAPGC